MDISVHDTVLHIEEGHGECGGVGGPDASRGQGTSVTWAD